MAIVKGNSNGGASSDDLGSEGGAADLSGQVDLYAGTESAYEDLEASDDEASEEEESDSLEEGEEEEDESLEEDDEGLEDGDEDEEESEVPAKSKKGSTTVRVKGEDVTIPDSTKIAITVDGEEEFVTLGEMKQAAAGNVSYHTRIREVEQERKKVQAQSDAVESERKDRNNYVNKIAVLDRALSHLIKKGDFENILNEVVAYYGESQDAFWENYDKVNENFYQQWFKLSEGEQTVLKERRKIGFKEASIRRKERQQQEAEAANRIDATTGEILKTSGLTRAEVNAAWGELAQLAKTGQLSKAQIDYIDSLDQVDKFRYTAAFAQSRKVDSKIKKVIDKDFPKLSKKYSRIVQKLQDTLKPEHLMQATEKNISTLIRKIFVAQESSEKVSERGKSRNRKSSPTTSSRDKAPQRPRRQAGEASQKNDDEDEYGSENGRKSSESFWGDTFSPIAKLP